MIYLIKTKDNDFYKIGYTSNSVKKRLKSIQTCCPYKLEIINKVNGSIQEEKILHTLFKEHKTQGEWFKLDKIYLDILLNVMQHISTEIELPKKPSKKNRNKQRRIWYKWRLRANKVGIPLLNNCRPTQKEREDWINSIIKAELKEY